MIGFLGGTLPAEGRSAVERHVGACTACADLLTWAAADQTNDTGRLPGREGRPFVGQLQPGARIGRYQILGAVGRGGMGEVYAAYHPDLDRRIALKVVQGFDGSTGERRARLLREARAIARLSHPNVVAVHDAGTFGDRVFIAMELIDGKTIDAWLRAAPRGWREILDVFIAAGRGLAAAHAAGVIHRDFKPQNVMIGKDGAVRVMDFGLARLAEDDGNDVRESGDDDVPTVPIGIVTKTGAFIGTPAYMSPEQFRREASDERSDQFSFCIALHEALFGTRPAAALADAAVIRAETPARAPRTSVPAWLKTAVLRGAASDRNQRFSSMNALLDALDRGRSRTRRRMSALTAGVAVLTLSTGGWQLARGNRFACVVPHDRVASAWPSDPRAARRESIHRAFAATGRTTAETSWQRVSKVLDDYMTAWGTMYVDTCQATHVRREQSADVLGLRMSCLNDNLDQIRALTEALVTADGTAVAHAVQASTDITPVARCADVAVLKAAVPLPRNAGTLREVQQLRRSLNEVAALLDVGHFPQALSKVLALQASIEATGYKPLQGQALQLAGAAELAVDIDATRSEATLRKAAFLAEAAGDDITAVKATTMLVYVSGFRLGRVEEAGIWAELSHAILDRLGGDQEQLRAWVLVNLAAVRIRSGDFEGSRTLLKRSIAFKEHALGKSNRDVAVSLSNLSYASVEVGHPADALVEANRALEILRETDPETFSVAVTDANLGDAWSALGRYTEAERAYKDSIRIFEKEVGAKHPELAFALHGLGKTRVALGAASDGARLLEKALEIRIQPDADPALAADTQFALADALWKSGARARGVSLARSALNTFRARNRSARAEAVTSWLATHSRA